MTAGTNDTRIFRSAADSGSRRGSGQLPGAGVERHDSVPGPDVGGGWS